MPEATPPATRYRGRFAPSPTGALHFGSLVAALGSWLDARAAAGEWLLRIEDLDRPRCIAGAEEAILRQLDALGLFWDGEVIRQSRRGDAYEAALVALREAGEVYPCTCSRSVVEASASRRARDGAWIYPGTCRSERAIGARRPAWRLRVGETEIRFEDRLRGRVTENLAEAVGDFVLLRADGLFSYQLAVVVDDAWQGVTDVVRGSDLLESTPRQICLQQRLGLPRPRYLHLPVATNAAGEKLSKQTRAPALLAANAARDLCAALRFLGLRPGPEMSAAAPDEILAWGVAAWRLPGPHRMAKSSSTAD
jgi:glutamyl-Q tRNA(Asp) synthetase